MSAFLYFGCKIKHKSHSRSIYSYNYNMGGDDVLRAGNLRQKEVINIATGMRLGFVGDVEINFGDGRIESIVVPIQNRFFFFFGKNEEYIIPWNDIIRVGDDIILVDMPGLTNKKLR